MPAFRFTHFLTAFAVALPLALIQSAPPSTAATAAPAPPEPDSYALQARRAGHRIEVPEQRTTSREVYVNPDGSHTMVQHVAPVRTSAGTGIDLTLRAGKDGRVRPAAADTGLALSGGGPGAGLVSLGNRLRLGWPGVLPKPVLSGDTATYAEVLPGVDLRMQARSTGFAKALIVKNRAAANNPALRELRFTLTGSGLSFRHQPDGTTLATDRRGRVVYTSGQPLMWDSAPEPATVGAASSLTGGVLTIRPDQSLLTAPTTTYPVTIDPSWDESANDLWTHINEDHVDQSYWDYDRAQGAKVGEAWGADTDTYRSLFNFSTAGLNGARITKAVFKIVLDHSPDGTPYPVDLYQTSPISRAGDVTWRNTTWLGFLGQVKGHAKDSEPDMSMGWETSELKALFQGIADRGEQRVSLGLKAPEEQNPYQWKRFRGETANIVINYNNAPRMPLKVNFDYPKRCGTAAAPTAINTASPAFSGVAGDPDGDSLVNRLEIHRAGDDSTVYSQNSGITSNGAAFTWSPVPAGTLSGGTPYYYTARSDDQVPDDGIDYGPPSPRCYFTIDSTAPGAPTAMSTDFPKGLPGKPAREVGIVKLSPAAGDSDVSEYLYGFSADRVLLTIKAKPDGTADLPVSVNTSARLWVRAVDRAGNPGPLMKETYVLLAKANPATTPVRGDINGDGAADVAMVLDQGYGRTTVWNVDSMNGSFATGTISWDSKNNGGFALSRSRPVRGDFTKDGRTDVAFFRDEPGRRVALYTLPSDGNRYDAPSTPVWKAAQPDWTIATAHVSAGDLTGDDADDIAVQLNTGNGTWRVVVYSGSNLSAPVQWLQTTASGGDWSATQPVLADVDGDKRDDLVVFRKLGACRTVADVYRSTGAGFAAPTTAYDGDYCLDKGHLEVGDVDADGKDDVVSVYDNGTGTTLKVLRSTGTTYTVADWWTGAGVDPLRTALQIGDFDRDQKADAALITSLDGGGREVSRLRSTGTAFTAPVSDWKETAVGAGSGPKFDLEPRTYELVSRNSGKCMEVAGASQTDPASIQQWDCFNGLHQRFRVVPVAGTEQYELQMVHERVDPADGKPRCVDVGAESVADGAPMVQWKCRGTGNQQVLLDYVEGSSYDTVFRVRFAHSDKCAAVENAGTANGAKVIQKTCAGVPEQQWILRAALNSTQLDGRYKIGDLRNEKGDYVLDIENCTPSSGVQIWDWIPASACQRWQLKPLGDDVYQIIDPSSGSALQVDSCSREPATSLVVTPVDSSECQRWRIEPAVDGSWTIQQADTGFTMDIPGCDPGKVDHLITWHYWNGSCQRWGLTKM
ncbi:RICIN domain-containing protein [Kribbella sp. NPDC005582]|uniref:RICIN domain-containing protein n=1 Tax=Kribbella sp. NPDC005582 TaxID=3156893 RepID=UPI0033A6E568